VQYGDREILHGISFDVQPRETIVILGGSGSGKRTLLRTMVGLERPTSGSVWVHGTNLAKASAAELDEVRKKIGLSFQGGALIGSMTVGENVALPLREHTKLEESTIEVMVRIKLQQVGLIKFQHFMPSQLRWRNEKAGGACTRDGDGSGDFIFRRAVGRDWIPSSRPASITLILNLKQALAVDYRRRYS
jgi:phospholipid/cholesterol/gamma-HCH transport system ATP-binding protein